jgi:uncharacterized ferritin-like protein (DUF455 family)
VSSSSPAPAETLRRFAERVLWGETLADKLLPPSGRDDSDPAGGKVPMFPGRPTELQAGRAGATFPNARELETDLGRGRALHLFANHELLALELLAVALIRWPDAPLAWRRGLVDTMVDEQVHLGLYLDRMAGLGVALGEVEVGRFFWDALAGAPNPVAFTAGLALALEQANLDHADFYGAAFRAAGDEPTALLMDRVLDDEVRHVALGLRWFRRWKDPSQSDWDAFVATLPPPLTPTRARGRLLAAGLRERAGFDAPFINALEVAGHSRGRVPQVWVFNPDCEAEIAQGPASSSSREVDALSRDLSLLPLFLAAAGDVVLVPEPVDAGYLQGLLHQGFVLPELAPVRAWPHDLRAPTLRGRKLGPLVPWGWSPAVAARLTSAFDAPTSWSDRRGALHGKDVALELLADVQVRLGPADWLHGDEALGRRCTSEDEVASALAQLDGPAVVKARLGTAGRRMIRCEAALEGTQVGWLRRVLSQQGAVVVEAWLPRIADLSWHFDVEPQKAPRFRGRVCFETTADGRFVGLRLGAGAMEPAVAALLQGREERVRRALGEGLRALMDRRCPDFVGPVGVDALVSRVPAGLRLKPVVELNPRWTMGRVGLALERRLAGGVPARWEQLPATLVPQAQQLMDNHPVVRDPRSGLLRQGVLCTNDPVCARQVVGLWAIGEVAVAAARSAAPLR